MFVGSCVGRIEKKSELTIARSLALISGDFKSFKQESDSHPFFEFPPRYVNSIYFDTPDLRSYEQGVEGDFSREKLRLRWYSETDFQRMIVPPGKIFLEVKRKKGHITFKEVSHYCEVKEQVTIREFIGQCEGLSARFPMQPYLFNSYYRHYIDLSNKGIRATVDTQLRFGNPLSMDCDATKVSSMKILEIKYPVNSNSALGEIEPKYSDKISKYQIGMELIY